MWQFYDHPVMEPVRLFVERVLEFLPNVLLMVAVLLVGALVARISRAFVRRFLKLASFDAFCQRSGLGEMLTRGGVHQSPSDLAGRIVFYLLALIFFFMAVAALDIEAINDLIASFFGYLPNLCVALGIAAASYLLSRFLHRSVLIAAVNAHVQYAGTLARSVQAAVLVLGLAVALEHLSIGRSTVLAAFSITFGGVILALALAFGLAGKDLAREFLERNLRRASGQEDKDDIQHL
ncbi:MAG: hypothetical protein ACE5JI_01020 [Acidobacteriota bacterium]